MAASGRALLTDSGLHARVAREAVPTVRARFCAALIGPRYEASYAELLAQRNGVQV